MPRTVFRILVAALCIPMVMSAQSSRAMTNAEVIEMVTAKVSDQVIVTAIQNSTNRVFDVSPGGLIALKKAGVSDVVVSAMQASTTGGLQTGGAPVVGRSSAIDALTETEVVFVIDATGRLVPLENPATNTQFGGFAGDREYLAGASSPVVIPQEGTLRFAVRLQSKASYWPKYMDELRKRPWAIQRLRVDKDRRYIQKDKQLLDVQPYGTPASGRDPKFGEMTYQTFILTTLGAVTAGEYAILHSLGGIAAAFSVAPRLGR